MTTVDVAILVPVLRRPWRVQPLLESIAAATPKPYHVLFIADADDQAELDALAGLDAARITVPPASTYPQKINRGYRAVDAPLVFLAADDLDFHPGWFEAARAQLDATAGVIGTNDGYNPRVLAGEHSTHSLVVRDYIDHRGGSEDEPGRVLHEGYRHWYCDDELVQTARARGAYRHAHDSHVEHLHPYAGKAPDDDVYRQGARHRGRDRVLYRKRKRRWVSAAR